MSQEPQRHRPRPEEDRVRIRRPQDDSWRADAVARSRHSRLLDGMRPPDHDSDPQRARLMCAEVCRELLGDLSPLLALLPYDERLRAQALAAHVVAMLDFANQPGLDGERLAQLNRWEFETESALAGRPAGQPVFVAMSEAHRHRPWPMEALEALGRVARRTAIRGADSHFDTQIAEAVCTALLEIRPRPEVSDLVARLLRGLATRRASLLGEPQSASPDAELSQPGYEAELDRIDRATLPRPWRRALRFLCAVADDARAARPGQLPPLSLGRRIRFLARALVRG